MSKVVLEVERLAQPITDELNLELVEVEYVKEGPNWYLRVYIDKEEGISIDECVLVSERLGAKLDEVDSVPDQYFLEVSSPGAERPLKKPADFEKAIGRHIHVKAYEQIQGDKEFEGVLLDYQPDFLTMQIKVKTAKKEIEIPVDKIAKARLAIAF